MTAQKQINTFVLPAEAREQNRPKRQAKNGLQKRSNINRF